MVRAWFRCHKQSRNRRREVLLVLLFQEKNGFGYRIVIELMMEETQAGAGHNHAIAVAGLDHQVIPDGAAGLGDVGYTAPASAVDIIREGEEGITTQGDPMDSS